MAVHSVGYCQVAGRDVREQDRRVGSPCPYCGAVLVEAHQGPGAGAASASSLPESGDENPTSSATSRVEGSLAPEGWVADPADLTRAGRYRKAARTTTHVSLIAVVAYLLVVLTTDFPLLPVLGVLLILIGVRFFYERRVTEIIGRKWTVSLELKEKLNELKEKR